MIKPAKRRRARERALQFLFGLDFTKYACDEVLEDFWEMTPAEPGVKRFAEHIIRGVCAHEADLDAQIEGALDNWKPDRIGYIERAILRIALFEIQYSEDVPLAVAINEAIEIAKDFGSDDSPRFINGVLDRVREQLTESGAE